MHQICQRDPKRLEILVIIMQSLKTTLVDGISVGSWFGQSKHRLMWTGFGRCQVVKWSGHTATVDGKIEQTLINEDCFLHGGQRSWKH